MMLFKFLIFYLPFEEFLLKYLPVSDFYYQVFRQLPDLLIIGALLAVLSGKALMRNGLITVTGLKVEMWLILFIVVALFNSLIIDEANIGVVILNLKALLRYVALIYILLNINISPNKLSATLSYIIYVSIAQAIFGFAQYFGGLGVRDFLSARTVETEVLGVSKTFTGDRFESVNDLMGTMGDNISFAFYFLVVTCLILNTKMKSSLLKFTFLLVTTFMILNSGSLVSMLGLGLLFYFELKRTKKDKIAIPVVIVGLTFFYVWLANYTPFVDQVIALTDQKFEGVMNSRLGLIIHVLPEILVTKYTCFGFTADKMVLVSFLNENVAMPYILSLVIQYIIEDVYWFALLAYFGVLGVIPFLIFFRRIWAFNNRNVCEVNYSFGRLRLNVAVKQLFGLTVLLCFFNQAFEVRAFSFFLWYLVAIGFCINKKHVLISTHK